MLAFNASHRRTLVWTLVVGAHVLVIFVLSREREPASSSPEARANDDLLLIQLQPESSANEIRKPAASTSSGLASRRANVRPPATSAVASDTPATRSEPKVDWDAAAQQAVAHAMTPNGASTMRGFGTTPVSPYRPCQRKKPKEWRPENKAGFAGGLPYVRVSKRCIVGLPFFACAIGALPPPKSDLFEDMHSNNNDDCLEPPISPR